MSSSILNPFSTNTGVNDGPKKIALSRNSTVPSAFSRTPPKSTSGALNRQMSSSGSVATAPASTITEYLKYMLGISAKTTKRSLSEEAECGSPDSLNNWLRQGSNPNELDAYGYTPLINASLRGCVRSANILIKNGADVNKKAMHGYSALHAAAQVREKKHRKTAF